MGLGSLEMLLRRPVTDAVLSRRKTWDGQIIRVTVPHHPDYGKYYRVASSVRNDDGSWWIIANPNAPLLREALPRGTHIYEYDGRSWDMKEDWFTCFPWWDLALALVLWPVMVVWVHNSFSGDPAAGGTEAIALLFFTALIWGMFANVWFYRREPVRGTKFAIALAAVNAAMAARHHEEHQRSMAMVPQWPGHDPNHQPYQTKVKRTPGKPFVGPGGYWYAYDEWGVMSLTTPPEKRT